MVSKYLHNCFCNFPVVLKMLQMTMTDSKIFEENILLGAGVPKGEMSDEQT